MKDESKFEVLFEEILARLESIEKRLGDGHGASSTNQGQLLEFFENRKIQVILDDSDHTKIINANLSLLRDFFPEAWQRIRVEYAKSKSQQKK
jgi:hypothetical protein